MSTPGGQAEVKAAAAVAVAGRMAGMRGLIPVVTRNNANKEFGWVLARPDVAAVVKAARAQVIAGGASLIAAAYQRAFEQSRLTATAYLAEMGVEPDWSPGPNSAYLQLLQDKWELSAGVVFQALYRQMSQAVARVQPRPSLAQDPVNGVPNVFQALGQDKQAALEQVLDDGIRALSFRAGVGATSAAAKAAGEALEALVPPSTDNPRLLKRWRISGLPGTCIHCRQLDGVTVPVGANFPIVGPLPVFGNVLSGPPRHPNCLPAGVVISGPRPEAATRRWYQGELVIIGTASGQQLPITPNHPVLTDWGWVPAGLLQPGDQVVHSVLGQGALPLVIPDEQQVPTLVEEIGRANEMGSLLQMPTAAQDFHGDGGHGDVDVVFPDRLLRNVGDTPVRQPLSESLFALGPGNPGVLDAGGSGGQLIRRVLHVSDGIMSSVRELCSFFWTESSHAEEIGVRSASEFHSGSDQPVGDDCSGAVIAGGQSQHTHTVGVLLEDVVYRQRQRVTASVLRPRWDPPSDEVSPDGRIRDAGQASDLLECLAGQVELDRVVEIRRVDWSGHVYNLDSVEGWYSANGLIVSNCRCHLELLLEDLTAQVSQPMLDFPAVDPAGVPVGGQVPPPPVAPARAASISAEQIRAMPAKTYHSVVAALIGTIRKFWGSAWKRGRKWFGF